MGRPTGLEPATLGTTNRCSNQLSYGRHSGLGVAAWRFPWTRALIRVAPPRTQATHMVLNPTIRKFGYPGTLVRELEHWVVLLRPAQVTLGSLVLAAKSDATAFGALPAGAFAELAT